MYFFATLGQSYEIYHSGQLSDKHILFALKVTQNLYFAMKKVFKVKNINP